MTVGWRTNGTWLFLRVEFNQDFLTEFKAAIPAHSRSWMPKPAACWRIKPIYKKDVQDLVQGYFNVALGEPEKIDFKPGGSVGESDAPNERVRTPDGIEALRQQLQGARTQIANLDLQLRLRDQVVATLQSQLEMAHHGRMSDSGDSFSIRRFLREFGAKGYRSLIRTCHPDVAENKDAAATFTKELTKLAAEMGIS
jgi:hypothetical protein